MKTRTCLTALALIAAMGTGSAGIASAQSTNQDSPAASGSGSATSPQGSGSTGSATSPGSGTNTLNQDGKDATIAPRGSEATAPSTATERDAVGGSATAGSGTTMQGETGMTATGSAAINRAAIGKDVVNQAGEDVGEIEDIVTDQSSNEVYAVVSVGGFLGIGDKNVLVPMDQLNVGSENVVLMSQGTADDLKGLPAFEDDTPGYQSVERDDTPMDGSAAGTGTTTPATPAR